MTEPHSPRQSPTEQSAWRLVADPLSLSTDLDTCWRQGRQVDAEAWGLVVLRLVRLAGSILTEAADRVGQRDTPVLLSPAQCLEALDASEGIQDSLEKLQQKYVRPGQDEPRSADGIMQADQGRFRLFEGGGKTTLELSLEGIDLVDEARALGVHYWMCRRCGRPTSEEYADHIIRRHPEVEPGEPVEPLHMSDMVSLVQSAKKPATTVYSAESPVYWASNRATRRWGEDKTAFHKWRAYAYLLDCELRELPRFEGIVYRAVPYRPPLSLYSKGHVVTWNQPSSTSEDPRVARQFLKSTGRGRPTGTIFVIHSVTGRPIEEHSLHKEEKEVLFPAGTQFQVVNQADVGLKRLLESAMRCSLSQVDVYEMRELVLDSWCDVERYLDAAQSMQNRELLDLIKQQPTQLLNVRNVVKVFCSTMSSLLTSEDGSTALHLAAAVPNNLLVVQLVCSGLQDGDGGAQNGAGKTALQVAVDMGHQDTALFLLQRFHGWQQLSRAECCTALPWVCAAGDKGLVEVLCTAAESTAAVQQGLMAACAQNQRSCIETLVEYHVDVGQAQADGQTAVMSAAQKGHASCVLELVRHRADVGAAREDGHTALMFAAEQGHVSCVEALIACQADVEAAKADGSTALLLAACYGHTPCVRALLGHKADVHATNKGGGTALMYADQHGHVECVEALAAHNADVNVVDPDGYTPLMMVAAKCGDAASVEALAGRGADVGAVHPNGRTALHFAAIAGRVAHVEALVAWRADVGAADGVGQTALMDAAQNGDVECVRALLRHRADPGAVHSTGQTAVMWAALGGHTACVQELVAHRADVGGGNNGGWTALAAARASGAAACAAALAALCGDSGAAGDGGEARTPEPRVAAVGEADGLAALCDRCGALVTAVAHGVYTTPFFTCDLCKRFYAVAGGIYHCSCGMDACRYCVGAGGLGGACGAGSEDVRSRGPTA